MEYTEYGGKIKITFLISQETFLFSISDSGLGIAVEHIPYVFDRFYRCDKVRSREKHHFGLGLSIVKMIIELHNGSVNIVSELKKGTTISFKIPMNY